MTAARQPDELNVDEGDGRSASVVADLERRRELLGDLPLFLLDDKITLEHQLAVQHVVDVDLPDLARLTALPESEQLAAMAERNEALERDRAAAWAAMEYAVNWIGRVFANDEVRVTEAEWLGVRNRLLNAGEFSHFMRAEGPDTW